jgi:hypothetical protein
LNHASELESFDTSSISFLLISVLGFLPDPTPEPSASPTYSPTEHPRLFGKSGKGSKGSKGSKSTKTLKNGSKSGKSAKSGWNDNYKGLFGNYKRVPGPLQKQEGVFEGVTGPLQKQEGVFEVSYSKSSAHQRRSIGGLWFPIVLACIVVASSAITIGL